MSRALPLSEVPPFRQGDTSHSALSGRRFRATAGAFDGEAERRAIDALARWVEITYAQALAQRPSMHVYIRHLPDGIQRQIDGLRMHPRIQDAILAQFNQRARLVPMAHTDELYVSHYNKDGGGDQGLFDRHYDGNLGFLRFVSVVRALIYLQSDRSYTVVFADSGLRQAFGTYDWGLLDFHRELHWVEGEYSPGGAQRILLKCNYLVAPRGAEWAVELAMAANTAVFYVVKAAMEYSKSPRTPAQVVVGWVCNAARRLNNVHPALPWALLAAAAVAAVAALVAAVR
jgi:hypothetical protein